jgi:hypothetical protein
MSEQRLLELTFAKSIADGCDLKLDGRELNTVEHMKISIDGTGAELFMVLFLDREGSQRTVEELSGKTILVSINDGEAFEIRLRIEARYCRQGLGL